MESSDIREAIAKHRNKLFYALALVFACAGIMMLPSSEEQRRRERFPTPVAMPVRPQVRTCFDQVGDEVVSVPLGSRLVMTRNQGTCQAIVERFDNIFEETVLLPNSKRASVWFTQDPINGGLKRLSQPPQ